MTLAEKIAAKNARLVAIKDRLTELKGLSETDDATLTNLLGNFSQEWT